MLEEFVSYIGYSDLFDQKAPLAALKKELRQFKMSNVISALAGVNFCLAREMLASDKTGMQELQRFLVANFIDDEILEGRLKPRFGQAQCDERPIFVRQQMLALLRLCAQICSESAPMIMNGKQQGGYTFGRCCLMMNDHLTRSKELSAINVGTVPKRRKHLALQMAPLFELYNPPNLQLAMVRSDILFTDILNSSEMKSKTQRELAGFDLADAFRRATGLTLEQYRDLAFSVFALYRTIEREELIKNAGVFAIDRLRCMDKSLIKQEDFDRYLILDSIKLSDLPARIKEQRPVLRYLDFVVFREKPLLELGGGHIICLDPCFLIEKLGAGLYWTVLNSLKDKDRDRAFQAFGYLFQLYVDHIMRRIYPPASGLFVSFPNFQSGEESFDGIIHLGEHLIVLEYKGGFLKQEAKYSGKAKTFEEELDRPKKFGIGKGAGVYQIVKKIERLFHRNLDKREQIPDLRLDQITKVTPVMVVQEPFLRAPFMNWMLNKKFLQLYRQSEITNRITIQPMMVIHVEDLELLMANVLENDFRFDQCLNARVVDDSEQLSVFRSFMRAYFPDYGKRRDPEMIKRFDAIFDRMSRNFGAVPWKP